MSVQSDIVIQFETEMDEIDDLIKQNTELKNRTNQLIEENTNLSVNNDRNISEINELKIELSRLEEIKEKNESAFKNYIMQLIEENTELSITNGNLNTNNNLNILNLDDMQIKLNRLEDLKEKNESELERMHDKCKELEMTLMIVDKDKNILLDRISILEQEIKESLYNTIDDTINNTINNTINSTTQIDASLHDIGCKYSNVNDTTADTNIIDFHPRNRRDEALLKIQQQLQQLEKNNIELSNQLENKTKEAEGWRIMFTHYPHLSRYNQVKKEEPKTEEINQTVKENEDIQSGNTNIDKEYADVAHETSEIHIQTKNLRYENYQISREYSDLKIKYEKLLKESSNQDIQLDSIYEKRTGLKSKIKLLEDEKSELKKMNQSLEDEKSELKKMNQRLEYQELKQNDFIQTLDDRIGDLGGKIDSLENTVVDIKNKNKVLQCENLSLTEHITELDSLIRRLEDDTTELSIINKYFENAKSSLETSYKCVKDDYDVLYSEHQALIQHIKPKTSTTNESCVGNISIGDMLCTSTNDNNDDVSKSRVVTSSPNNNYVVPECITSIGGKFISNISGREVGNLFAVIDEHPETKTNVDDMTREISELKISKELLTKKLEEIKANFEQAIYYLAEKDTSSYYTCVDNSQKHLFVDSKNSKYILCINIPYSSKIASIYLDEYFYKIFKSKGVHCTYDFIPNTLPYSIRFMKAKKNKNIYIYFDAYCLTIDIDDLINFQSDA